MRAIAHRLALVIATVLLEVVGLEEALADAGGAQLVVRVEKKEDLHLAEAHLLAQLVALRLR